MNRWWIPSRFDPPDAGPSVNITGPKGQPRLVQQSAGFTACRFRIDISCREDTCWNGSGGADAGPFRATFNVLPVLNWLNPKISLTNTSPELDWTGGDPNGYVVSTSVAAASVFPCNHALHRSSRCRLIANSGLRLFHRMRIILIRITAAALSSNNRA